MSDTSQGPGWWQASDGKWYPPEQAPGAQPAPPAQPVQPQWGQQAPTGFASDGSPPPKKSKTTRNVLIAVLAVFLLLGGGCAALLFAGSSALNEAVDSVNDDLESSGAAADGEPAGDNTTVPQAETSDATCVYIGTGGFRGDGMQVEVSFTNPLGDVNGIEVTFALIDGEGGSRFYTGTAGGLDLQDISFPSANEQFRLTVDTGDVLPPNVEGSTIGCTVLEIEESLDIGGFERASDADACEVLGIDSSGRIDLELSVTSPYADTTTVQTWWAVQAPGQVRFDSDTEVTDLVGAGETFRINPEFGVEKPEWVGDGAITCTVLGFWDQGR
jgi:hypothetical protein